MSFVLDTEPFLYTGQSWNDIPRDVTRVKVDPSVKVIGKLAFKDCRQLLHVDLNEGLEQIDEWAFGGCTSLHCIMVPPTVLTIGGFAFLDCTQLMHVDLCEGLDRIDSPCAFASCTSLRRIIVPSTVKVIGKLAFARCTQLMDVRLCEGLLEQIDNFAFTGCTSLQRIIVPSTVKVIGCSTFAGCTQLMDVQLCEGLEQIDKEAFSGCTSLERIRIPSSVKVIKVICQGLPFTFEGCDRLEAVEFCDEIEQLVDEASLLWWKNGLSINSLETYSFLAQQNIPARLNLIKLKEWKNNIHTMLQRIPEKTRFYKFGFDYFDSINSRLSVYEHLQEANIPPLLELALWKWKMSEQANNNYDINERVKLQCRRNSISMVPIIIQNVLSFL